MIKIIFSKIFFQIFLKLCNICLLKLVARDEQVASGLRKERSLNLFIKPYNQSSPADRFFVHDCVFFVLITVLLAAGRV